MAYTVHDVARHIGVEITGGGQAELTHAAALDRAGPGSLSFIVSAKYLSQLKKTQASAVITPPALACRCPTTALVADNPYLSFARALRLLHPPANAPAGIHASAVIHPDCDIGDNVHIGAHVVISEKCRLASNVVIGAASVISAPVSIGAGSCLLARVTIVGPAELGQRVLVHPGAVIGSDGFGLADNGGVWEKIPQIGRVLIGNDVEIGANTTVDRGALEDTVIGDGVKLDNQIQVAHNVKIGAHTAIAGCAGIAGSAIIGRHCAIGGGAGIQGHIEITDGVRVTGMTVIRQSIAAPGAYTSGTAAQDNKHWLRNATRFKNLDSLVRRVNRLAKKIDSIEKRN